MKADTEDTTHYGYNVRKIRGLVDMSQIDLAEKLGMNPTQLNRIERQETIDDEILDRIAAELGVSTEFIKNYNHEAAVTTIISNNTFNDESDMNKAINGNSSTGSSPKNTVENNNPLDTIKEVYEKLLAEKDERIALLEKEIQKLEK